MCILCLIWESLVCFSYLLAALYLPTDNPEKFRLLKQVEGDSFVLLENKEERFPFVFERDKSGSVTGVRYHSNTGYRIEH